MSVVTVLVLAFMKKFQRAIYYTELVKSLYKYQDPTMTPKHL